MYKLITTEQLKGSKTCKPEVIELIFKTKREAQSWNKKIKNNPNYSNTSTQKIS